MAIHNDAVEEILQAGTDDAEADEEGRAPEGSTDPRKPFWLPDAENPEEPLTPAVRRAIRDVVQPLYQQLVYEVEDALQRSIGMSVVQLTWMEVLHQLDLEALLGLEGARGAPFLQEGMLKQQMQLAQIKAKLIATLMRVRQWAADQMAAPDWAPPLSVPGPGRWAAEPAGAYQPAPSDAGEQQNEGAARPRAATRAPAAAPSDQSAIARLATEILENWNPVSQNGPSPLSGIIGNPPRPGG